MEKYSKIINLTFNMVVAAGVGIYYFDGWAAVLYTLFGFAFMNTLDALINYLKVKFGW